VSPRDLSDSDYQALASFRHKLRRFVAFSEERAREVGLEPRQHQLLLLLRGLPTGVEPTVQVIADRLVVRHHTAVELLDRLEHAKLVTRTRATDDRRRAHVALTARGRELLRRLSLAHRDELRRTAPELVDALLAVLRQSRSAA
jgi:DNA-binding MarR family transcriptional regulator